MKVLLLQRDIVWGDPGANIVSLREEFSTIGKADLYVLPEMWTTGFATTPEGIAEKDGKGLSCMVELAREKDAAVAGSIATFENGKYYNRFYFVTPTRVFHYDKHHLFTYSGEDRHYSAGQEKVIVQWRGVRFRMIVCYDLRFPAWCRNTRENRYDALLCVASWPKPRVEAWSALLKARAIENQAYVIGVNRTGTDPSCEYVPSSAFIDPYGNPAEEIDIEELQAFRNKFPVLEDAD